MKWQTKLKNAQAEKPENTAVYCLWLYKINHQFGYTRMGLMTADFDQAHHQLEKIYGKPVTNLHKAVND